MKRAGRAFQGILTSLAVALLVLGALSLSLSEGALRLQPSASVTASLPPVNLTPLPGSAQNTEIIPTIALATLTPVQPTACPQPAGWERYTIELGDSLPALALSRAISEDELMQANCLVSPRLDPGAFLYLPPAEIASPSPTTSSATATLALFQPSPVPCGRPAGWIAYTVQPGETLFQLSQAFGISVEELQHANCLGDSTLIRAGSQIWVPNVPTRVVSATPSSTPRPAGTRTPTATSTSSNTPTATASATSTETATASATATLTPVNTAAVTP